MSFGKGIATFGMWIAVGMVADADPLAALVLGYPLLFLTWLLWREASL